MIHKTTKCDFFGLGGFALRVNDLRLHARETSEYIKKSKPNVFRVKTSRLLRTFYIPIYIPCICVFESNKYDITFTKPKTCM